MPATESSISGFKIFFLPGVKGAHTFWYKRPDYSSMFFMSDKSVIENRHGNRRYKLITLIGGCRTAVAVPANFVG